MMSAGLGIFAMLIIIFSTVTSTYLDVYSVMIIIELLCIIVNKIRRKENA